MPQLSYPPFDGKPYNWKNQANGRFLSLLHGPVKAGACPATTVDTANRKLHAWTVGPTVDGYFLRNFSSGRYFSWTAKASWKIVPAGNGFQLLVSNSEALTLSTSGNAVTVSKPDVNNKSQIWEVHPASANILTSYVVKPFKRAPELYKVRNLVKNGVQAINETVTILNDAASKGETDVLGVDEFDARVEEAVLNLKAAEDAAKAWKDAIIKEQTRIQTDIAKHKTEISFINVKLASASDRVKSQAKLVKEAASKVGKIKEEYDEVMKKLEEAEEREDDAQDEKDRRDRMWDYMHSPEYIGASYDPSYGYSGYDLGVFMEARRGIEANAELKSAQKARGELKIQLGGAWGVYSGAKRDLDARKAVTKGIKKEIADSKARQGELEILDNRLAETAKKLPPMVVKVATCIQNVTNAFNTAGAVQSSISLSSAQENIKDLLTQLGLDVKAQGAIARLDAKALKAVDTQIVTIRQHASKAGRA